MRDTIKQIREAREGATQGEWSTDETETDRPVVGVKRSSAARKITNHFTVLFESDWGTKEDADYITLLHNNAEELIRMAEAGQALADGVSNWLSHQIGLNIVMTGTGVLGDYLNTYNKTVSK